MAYRYPCNMPKGDAACKQEENEAVWLLAMRISWHSSSFAKQSDYLCLVLWLSDLLSPLLCPRQHCLPRTVYTLTRQVPVWPCIPSSGHTLIPTKSYCDYKTTRECHKRLDFKNLVQYGFQRDSQVSIWFFHIWFYGELNKLSELE